MKTIATHSYVGNRWARLEYNTVTRTARVCVSCDDVWIAVERFGNLGNARAYFYGLDAGAPGESAAHAARISFYSREGWCLQDMAFLTEVDAAEWFGTIDAPGGSDLPSGWYVATLQHFANDVPVVVGTVYNGFAS